MTHEEIFEKARGHVADALGIDPGEVTEGASFAGDLGAESLDMLDMLFRVEKSLGVRITMADIGVRIRGGLSVEEFAQDGKVTPAGLAQLRRALPQVNLEALNGDLAADNVFTLFTVRNLVDLVEERVTAAAGR